MRPETLWDRVARGCGCTWSMRAPPGHQGSEQGCGAREAPGAPGDTALPANPTWDKRSSPAAAAPSQASLCQHTTFWALSCAPGAGRAVPLRAASWCHAGDARHTKSQVGTSPGGSSPGSPLQEGPFKASSAPRSPLLLASSCSSPCPVEGGAAAPRVSGCAWGTGGEHGPVEARRCQGGKADAAPASRECRGQLPWPAVPGEHLWRLQQPCTRGLSRTEAW